MSNAQNQQNQNPQGAGDAEKAKAAPVVLGPKLGKRAPKHDPRTLRLAKYLGGNLPKPPAVVDYGTKVPQWGMMDNDRIGDCTIAGAGHLIMQWSSLASTMVTPPDKDILAVYSKISGYDPATGQNDNGCVMLDVLKYWKKYGIAGHKIDGFVAVNLRNLAEVRAAMWLFGGLYLGLALPQTAESQKIWDVPKSQRGPGAPGSWGGHCVPITAEDGKYLTCVTWSARLQMTWKFFSAYCDECYAVLSKDWIAKSGKAPNGFDIKTLLADLKAVS